jgi:hypothetical protein
MASPAERNEISQQLVAANPGVSQMVQMYFVALAADAALRPTANAIASLDRLPSAGAKIGGVVSESETREPQVTTAGALANVGGDWIRACVSLARLPPPFWAKGCV